MQDSDPAQRVLLVDDQPDNLDILLSYLEREEFAISVAVNGEEALEVANKTQPDLILLDILMPGMDGCETCRHLKENPKTRDIPVIFMSSLTDTIDKVKGFTVGGVDYVVKPYQQEEVMARIRTHLTLRRQQRELAARNHELECLNQGLREEIDRRERAEDALANVGSRLSTISEEEARRWGLSGFIGNSSTIARIIEEVRRLQDVDRINVLILGESGTGKELIARALHYGSERRDASFVAVNCSAIPAELAESSFFGHLRGAFTGASSNRKGYFEQAHGGTLFLDEMGDMPLSLQAKLLRTIEQGTLTPVGGTDEVRVKVRIVAATNADLAARMADGSSRSDLYYRLAGYTVHLPPLRERRDDIPLLAEHFLRLFAEEMGKPKPKLEGRALKRLQEYGFPGNIRELKNIVEHALIVSRGETILEQHLHLPDATTASQGPAYTGMSGNEKRSPNPPGVPPAIPAEPIQRGDHSEETILEYVRVHDRITNSECQALLGVGHQRASYLLKKLHREGILLRKGSRRWSWYRLATAPEQPRYP